MLRAVAIKRAGQKHPGEIIDTLLLDYEARRAPDGRCLGLKGTQIEIVLAQSAPIATDDCLVLEDGRLIEVVARPEPLLEVRALGAASLARLAWHLGERARGNRAGHRGSLRTGEWGLCWRSPSS